MYNPVFFFVANSKLRLSCPHLLVVLLCTTFVGGSDSNVGPRRPNIVIHHTFSHQPPSGEMQDETTNGRKS
jgi:hypothetical protein